VTSDVKLIHVLAMLAGFIGTGVVVHRRRPLLVLALWSGLTASALGELVVLWMLNPPHDARFFRQLPAGMYLYWHYAVFVIGGWVAFVTVLIVEIGNQSWVRRVAATHRITLLLVVPMLTWFGAFVGLNTLCNPAPLMADQSTRDQFAGAWRDAAIWAAVAAAIASLLWMRADSRTTSVSTAHEASRFATIAAAIVTGSLSAPAIFFGLLTIVGTAGVDVVRGPLGIPWFLAGVFSMMVTPAATVAAVVCSFMRTVNASAKLALWTVILCATAASFTATALTRIGN
jgi:hypothetical protein